METGTDFFLSNRWSGKEEPSADQLSNQVIQLQKELEQTHAHYQKLLETVAGPDWTDDPGPVERPLGGILHRSRSAHPSGRGSNSSGNSSPPADSPHAHVGFAPPESPAAPQVVSPLAPSTPAQQAEVRASRLEKQVNSLNAALHSADMAVAARSSELEALRDRMASKEHMQFKEIKKLRAACVELRTQCDEEKVVLQGRVDKAAARAEEERVRLTREADVLRSQLAEVTGSIGNMIQGRSVRVDGERKQREAVVAEREQATRQQLASLALEHDKQVDNLREQSSFFLVRKGEEIVNLRGELAAVRRAYAAEVEALRAEVEYLAVYAERMTEVLRRLESGLYTSHEFQGVKMFNVPPRDKPATLGSDRLRYLASRTELASALLALTEPACVCSADGAAPGGGGGSASSPNLSFLPPSATPGGLPPNSPPPPGGRMTSATSTRSTNLWGGAGSAIDSALDSTNRSAFWPSPKRVSSATPPPLALESLRSQWEAETRAAVTAQVLVDLKTDSTVEYIRSLETQVARYRQEIQVEKKRTTDVMVALRAAQRASAVSSSRSIGRVLINGTSVARPPCWGPGHRPGTASRPGSADVLSAVPSDLRRSTTSLANLTSSFRDNSVGY